MGSSVNNHLLPTCTRLLCFWPLWLLPLLTTLQPMAPLPQPITQHQPTNQLRSSPLSPTPTSMVWLMTTPRLTSRRPRPRMPTVLLPDPSPSLFPTVVSRPQPTPMTTTMVSSPRLPTAERPSTPQSPREDTATPLPMLPLLPQPTTPK